MAVAAGVSHSLAIHAIPKIGLSSEMLSFGDQGIGTRGTAQTLMITNRGSGPLTIWEIALTGSQVVVTELLPLGTTFVSSTASQGNCVAPVPGAIRTLTCTIGSIASGTVATRKLVVKVTAAGGETLSNTATVRANSPDPNSANNTAKLTTRVFGSKR
jgi:uncharacterized repeat protein (TIGR01451 family)